MLPFIKPHPLQKTSQELRGDLLDLVYKNGGHIGGSLSSLDLITAVYFSQLFNLKKDHFVLPHFSQPIFVQLYQRIQRHPQ